MKRNEALTHVTMWVDPENTMLRERSLTLGPRVDDSICRDCPELGKPMDTENRLVVDQGDGRMETDH